MLLLSRNEALKWKRFLPLAANANNPYSNRSFIDLPASNSHLTIHLQARRNGWDTGNADDSGALIRDAVDTVGTVYTVHTWESKERGETKDTWNTKHTANTRDTKLGRPVVKPINCVL